MRGREGSRGLDQPFTIAPCTTRLVLAAHHQGPSESSPDAPLVQHDARGTLSPPSPSLPPPARLLLLHSRTRNSLTQHSHSCCSRHSQALPRAPVAGTLCQSTGCKISQLTTVDNRATAAPAILFKTFLNFGYPIPPALPIPRSRRYTRPPDGRAKARSAASSRRQASGAGGARGRRRMRQQELESAGAGAGRRGCATMGRPCGAGGAA